MTGFSTEQQRRGGQTSAARRRRTTYEVAEYASGVDMNPSSRTNEELRGVQVALAGIALELDAGEGGLREVLEVLGLLRRFDAVRLDPRRSTASCEPWTGTLRGYRQHIRASSTPCPACTNERVRDLAARWKRMGIETDEVVMPT